MKCPIPLNTSFTQAIIFFIEGTLWWHAHSDWSRATINGVIIILPALGTTYLFPKPYARRGYPKCYKGDVMTIIDEALTTGGDPKISDAITINGQPENLYECSNIWYMEDQIRTTYCLPVNYGRPIFYT
ncbi:laccase-14 [Quercus suber]|uniref:Laccase-14 n=1 Tax=Quercus suber TaxID=58331 RepID=A0AAW0LER3_QUESU